MEIGLATEVYNGLLDAGEALIPEGGIVALLRDLGVIIGMYGLYSNSKQEKEAVERQVRTSVYSNSLRILQMFVKSPELRPFFYSNKSLPDDSDFRHKVLAACEIMCDHWEGMVIADEADNETDDIWRSYMCGIYSTSPSLRYFLQHEGYRFDEKFLAVFSLKIEDCRKQREEDLVQMGVTPLRPKKRQRRRAFGKR